MSKLVLSGAQSSGTLHIGNYFGALRQFIDLSNNHESRLFLADLHALTTVHGRDVLQKNIFDQVRVYLAIGLDPEKVAIFKQSDTPEVTELAWIFNCLTTMPQLMRAHSFKDAEAKNKEVSVGLFDYPVLMAADILIHNATTIPVGKDQKQHIEIAREIARKFNNTYGEMFVEPQEYVIESVETVPGIDGEKMSKSKGNTIPLFATHEEIKKAVMSIPTDSASLEDSKNPDTNTIYKIHSLFLDDSEKEAVRAKYLAGGMGYKEAKDMCIESIEKFIAPIREKYNSISDDDVRRILEDGKEKIRPIIIKQMEAVRKAVGLAL
jgi:tryptophanyl-tRNA synthetase